MIETIRIVKDNGRTGFATINKADFDPKRHELFAEGATGAEWTVIKLKARLAELGIAIPRGASKDEMIALLPEDER